MLWVLAVLAVGSAILSAVAWFGPDLPGDFRHMLAAEVASDKAGPRPILTEADIAALPAWVLRYVRHSGAIGKPRVASITVTYDAQMFSNPGAAAMTGIAMQYDRFDPPKRLFFLPTQMFGLPVKVLHDYDDIAATMKVRLAGLYNVVDAGGTDFSRIETLTLLNDLCIFAPSWLSDPRLTWQALDDHSAKVTFRNGPFSVGATLYINDAGELVNFTSQDRAALASDGSARPLPWSTPLRSYRDFHGMNIASCGEAIWSQPGGDFAYGKFTITDVQMN